jgi:hypothetical protein
MSKSRAGGPELRLRGSHFFSLSVSAYGGALKKRYNLLALMDSGILRHGIMTAISSSCLSLMFVIVCRPLCLSHSG